MRISICVIAATLVAFVGADNAWADAEPGQGYLSIMGSYMDDDENRDTEDGINGVHFGIGYVLNENWNVEGYMSAAYVDGNDQDHTGLGVDFQRFFRRGEKFSPYIFGGVGFLQINFDGPTSKKEGPMGSLGAGFLLNLGDSDLTLRGEFRSRYERASERNLTDELWSLGLHIPFGEGSSRFVDSDGDGVADGIDRCPNTPAGASVDAYGCELDSDGDGVVDSRDRCPGTPQGVAVDTNGCPVDSDGDGVTDDMDKCPGTVAGAKVDADGCELDSDGDGVVDRLDECPGTPAGVQVDIKGCEIKEEIRLQGVNFESNSDRLLPGATRVLDDAVATLKKNPTIEFEVAGHTDSDGAAEYNEGLSARRAQTVYDYLAANGIAENRMSVRGYGESQPIADNSTSAGKAQNRRVVLRITDR